MFVFVPRIISGSIRGGTYHGWSRTRQSSGNCHRLNAGVFSDCKKFLPHPPAPDSYSTFEFECARGPTGGAPRMACGAVIIGWRKLCLVRQIWCVHTKV